MALDKQEANKFEAICGWVGLVVIGVSAVLAFIIAFIGFCMVFYAMFIGDGYWQWVSDASK